MTIMGRRRLIAGLALPALVPPAFGQPLEEGLRAIAARRGITFGAAASTRWLGRDPAYDAALAREAATLVPEGEGKWDSLQPRQGQFTLREMEPILAFADRHGQAVRGHTLGWHTAMPRWVWAALDGAPAARAAALLEAHILGVLGMTRGRIRDWDVVNEAIADPDLLPDQDLRDGAWWRAIGPGWIDLAFQTARAADPESRLVINDYGLEADWPRAAEKRARMLRLLRGMRERGVPVQALGIQAHMPLDQPFSPAPFAAFLREVRGLGLEVLLTELDVIEPAGQPLRDADIPARDEAVAARAHAVVSTALAEGCRMVLTWGLADPHSWLNAWAPARRADGAVVRALPLDAQYRRKPFWHALARAFEGR